MHPRRLSRIGNSNRQFVLGDCRGSSKRLTRPVALQHPVLTNKRIRGRVSFGNADGHPAATGLQLVASNQ